MIIFQYWNTKTPPPEVVPLIESFAQLNPDFEHRLFDEERADDFIAENFSARELAAFRSCAVPAMQSDYFRYCALFRLGGFYADADMRCLRPLAPLIETVDIAEFYSWELLVYSAPLVFPTKEHPFLELVLEIATANIERRISNNVALVTGPQILHVLLSIRGRSIEQHLERMRNSETEPDRLRLIELVCSEVLAFDEARLARIFAEVNCAQARKTLPFIEYLDPPYKKTGAHWTKWEGSIFKQMPVSGSASRPSLPGL